MKCRCAPVHVSPEKQRFSPVRSARGEASTEPGARQQDLSCHRELKFDAPCNSAHSMSRADAVCLHLHKAKKEKSPNSTTHRYLFAIDNALPHPPLLGTPQAQKPLCRPAAPLPVSFPFACLAHARTGAPPATENRLQTLQSAIIYTILLAS